MADTKVTNETDLGTLSGAEELYAVRGGDTDGKTTVANILGAMGLSLPDVNPQNAGKPFIDGNSRIAISGGAGYFPELLTKNFEQVSWVPPVSAKFTITASSNPADGDIITIGGKTYTFQNTLTDVDGNVQIGATSTDTMDALATALILGAGSGITYAVSTTRNKQVADAVPAAQTVNITVIAGAGGNAVSGAVSTSGSWFAGTGTTQTGVIGSFIVSGGYFQDPSNFYNWRQSFGQSLAIDLMSYVDHPLFNPGSAFLMVGVGGSSPSVHYTVLDSAAPLYGIFIQGDGTTSISDYSHGLPAIIPRYRRTFVVPGAATLTPIYLTNMFGNPGIISVLEYVGGIVVDHTTAVNIYAGTPYSSQSYITLSVETTGSTLVVEAWDSLWTD